jgi:ABC-type uncharacterized transport system substrate-binding protein
MRRPEAMAALILKGANPAELPYEREIKLEMVLKLKATRRLGIDLPPSVRIAADEVIE